MEREELKAVKDNPKSTALELILYSIVSKAMTTGDQQRLDFVLNRLLGKIKDNVSVEIDTSPNMIRTFAMRSLERPELVSAIELIENAENNSGNSDPIQMGITTSLVRPEDH